MDNDQDNDDDDDDDDEPDDDLDLVSVFAHGAAPHELEVSHLSNLLSWSSYNVLVMIIM